ncbi:MAG: hypothetical protein ACYTBP_11870 [Planctomycetota bacterium]|jgi:hypothetical protein
MKKNGTILPHWSLESIRPALENYHIQNGAFEPQSGWEQEYTIWTLYPPFPKIGYEASGAGFLKIRKITHSQKVQYNVECKVKLGLKYKLFHATIYADNNLLHTPVSWKVEDQMLDQDQRAAALTKINISANVEGNQLLFSGGIEKTIKLNRPWTLDYVLFDVLQQLNFNKSEPLLFDMYENFDMFRPNQEISRCGDVVAIVQGKSLNLHGFKQLGCGILPRHYWVNDQRQLLFVIGCHVAYILKTDK